MRSPAVFVLFVLVLVALPRPGAAWDRLDHRPPPLPPLVTGWEPYPALMLMGPIRRTPYRHHRRYRPWTKAWFRYCRRTYRSFNSSTGYYVTYSGYRRFCR